MTVDRSELPPASDGPVLDRPGADGAASSGPAPAQAVPDERIRWNWVDAVWVVGLVVLSFVITVVAVVRATSLSQYDEASHIDYAWSIANGELPFAGSQMAPEVLREWSCRGQEGLSLLAPCAGPYPVSEYAVRGENYNYGHPPTYYAITAVAASLGDALPIGITFVTAARLSGGGWLAAALVALYLVLRQWRVPRLLSGSAAVVLAAVPSVAHASSIVTNDAPGVLIGVLALWVLTRIAVRDRLGWVLPTVVTLFAVSTKVMHTVAVLAVAAVVLGMAIAAFRAGDARRGRALGGISVAVVGTTALVHAGWSYFQSMRGMPNWVNPVQGINTTPVEGNPLSEWIPTLFSAFGLSQTFYLQSSLMSFAVVASATGLAVLFTAAPFANVSAFAVGDPRRLVGWAALVGVAAVPLLVQVQIYLLFQDYFPFVSSRYAISLLPLTIAAFALVAQARTWRVAPAVVAATVIGALLLSFTGVL